MCKKFIGEMLIRENDEGGLERLGTWSDSDAGLIKEEGRWEGDGGVWALC